MNLLSFLVTWDAYYLKSEAEHELDIKLGTGKPLSVPTVHNPDGTIQAANYYEASKHLNGTTLQGDEGRTIMRIGHNLWKIVNLPWDTEFEDE